MKQTKILTPLLAVLFSWVSPLAVEATLIPIDLIDGDWANAVPASNATIANSGTGGGLSTARWGTAASAGGQSGYDFESATTPLNAQSDGTPFALGLFRHINYPIASGTSIDTIDLQLKLGSVFSVNSTFNIDHNETPNNTNFPDDIVTIQNPIVNQQFTYLTDTYFFNLIGFSADGGTTVTTVFNTKEDAVNTIGLYGSITKERVTVPDSGLTIAMLGLSLLGFGTIRRKFK